MGGQRLSSEIYGKYGESATDAILALLVLSQGST